MMSNQQVTKKISRVGDYITIPVDISNTGSYDAQNVQVAISVPNGISQVQSTPSKGVYEDFVWQIGDLPSKAKATLVLVFEVDDVSLAPYEVTAQITSGTPDDISEEPLTWVIENCTATPSAGSNDRTTVHHGDLKVEDTLCDSGVTKYVQVGQTTNVSTLTLNENGEYHLSFLDPTVEASFSYKIQCVVGADTTDASGPTEITVLPIFATQPQAALVAGNPGYHVFTPADGSAATTFKTGWTLASEGDNVGEVKFTYPDGTATSLEISQSLTTLQVSNDNRNLLFTDKDGQVNTIFMGGLVQELQGKGFLSRDATAGTITFEDGVGGSQTIDYAKEAFLASVAYDNVAEEVVFTLTSGGDVRIARDLLRGPDVVTTIVVDAATGVATYTNEEDTGVDFLTGLTVDTDTPNVFKFYRGTTLVATIDNTTIPSITIVTADVDNLLEEGSDGGVSLPTTVLNTHIDPITKVVTLRGPSATSTLPLYAPFTAQRTGTDIVISHDGDTNTIDLSTVLATARIESGSLIFKDINGDDSLSLALTLLNINESFTKISDTVLRFVGSSGVQQDVTISAGFKSTIVDHATFGQKHEDGDGTGIDIVFNLKDKDGNYIVFTDRAGRESPPIAICDGCCEPVDYDSANLPSGVLSFSVSSGERQLKALPVSITDNLTECGCAKTLKPAYSDIASDTMPVISITGDHHSIVLEAGVFTTAQTEAISVEVLCGNLAVANLTITVNGSV